MRALKQNTAETGRDQDEQLLEHSNRVQRIMGMLHEVSASVFSTKYLAMVIHHHWQWRPQVSVDRAPNGTRPVVANFMVGW